MIDDAFVFDGVCHVFNFDKSNAFGKPGEMFIEHLYAFHQVLNAPGEKTLTREEYMREWTADEIARMVFELGKVRSDGAQISRSDDFLGVDQPARRKEGARSDGDSGQGVWRPWV